ncbi:hypothetical protein AVEN_242077-1 [Araneus ventricosus]|uniref:Uncharacterized protein n=1 Tax=Araneus ventricosus TaxID=182803 RepID=A0A4Y2T811_ARAVE|nr:hypothetical protein AVEN_242077-1 [Araneus ventricosus]
MHSQSKSATPNAQNNEEKARFLLSHHTELREPDRAEDRGALFTSTPDMEQLRKPRKKRKDDKEFLEEFIYTCRYREMGGAKNEEEAVHLRNAFLERVRRKELHQRAVLQYKMFTISYSLLVT